MARTHTHTYTEAHTSARTQGVLRTHQRRQQLVFSNRLTGLGTQRRKNQMKKKSEKERWCVVVVLPPFAPSLVRPCLWVNGSLQGWVEGQSSRVGSVSLGMLSID